MVEGGGRERGEEGNPPQGGGTQLPRSVQSLSRDREEEGRSLYLSCYISVFIFSSTGRVGGGLLCLWATPSDKVGGSVAASEGRAGQGGWSPPSPWSSPFSLVWVS